MSALPGEEGYLLSSAEASQAVKITRAAMVRIERIITL